MPLLLMTPWQVHYVVANSSEVVACVCVRGLSAQNVLLCLLVALERPRR